MTYIGTDARRALTFGSLFAGIGGFDLGFERAGMQCKWQVEIDPYCQKVLAKHWPHVRRHDDVRTFPPAPIGDWRVDVICGGDPCQGNSNAGSVWKAKHPDMGRELVRIVEQLRPKIVVRENPYPSRPDAVWPWWRMRNELEGLGYAVLPFRLRSCCLGACHRRDRMFLLCEMPDAHSIAGASEGCYQATPTPSQVSKEVWKQRIRSYSGAVACCQLPDTYGDRLERLNWQGLSPRNDSREIGNGVAGGRENSVPTPRICRSRNEVPNLVDRVRALGNSVDPVVAEWIGRRIVEAAN